jgi:hypothetical protein
MGSDRLLLFLLNADPDLRSMHGNVRRGFDTETNLGATNIEDGDNDPLIPDDDLLSGFATQDQHMRSPGDGLLP